MLIFFNIEADTITAKGDIKAYPNDIYIVEIEENHFWGQ